MKPTLTHIPDELRGRIEATRMSLEYAKQMSTSLDLALRFGFSEQALEQEAKLQRLHAEAAAYGKGKKPGTTAAAASVGGGL